MLEFHIQAYEAAKTKRAKRDIFTSVFTAIQSCGGRFIRQAKDGHNWESLGSLQVREKIGHGLRHALASSSRATTSSRRLYDILGEEPKVVSLQRTTYSELPVESVNQTSDHYAHADPSKSSKRVQASCADPLPMNCTSCFENNPRSSLVNMLLSSSALRNSLNEPQELSSLELRCSNAMISLLLGSMKAPNNDEGETRFSFGDNSDVLEHIEDDFDVPYEALFLHDDACTLDSGRCVFSEDGLEEDCMFESMVDRVLASC